MAQNLSGSGTSPGIGFARLIEQQLGRQMETPAGQTAASEAANAAGLPMAATMPGHLQYREVVSGLPTSAAYSVKGASALGQAEGAPASPKEYVDRVWPHAVEASRSTGIPPQFLVAHSALESGWGQSEIKRADGSPSYNVFGIKAGKSWTGPTVEATTTEYVNGVAQTSVERFRAYGSYAEAFRDYAGLLRNNARFSGVIGSQDGTVFARGLQQAGYATDPVYADKLSRIINGPTLRQALIG